MSLMRTPSVHAPPMFSPCTIHLPESPFAVSITNQTYIVIFKRGWWYIPHTQLHIHTQTEPILLPWWLTQEVLKALNHCMQLLIVNIPDYWQTNRDLGLSTPVAKIKVIGQTVQAGERLPSTGQVDATKHIISLASRLIKNVGLSGTYLPDMTL